MFPWLLKYPPPVFFVPLISLLIFRCTQNPFLVFGFRSSPKSANRQISSYHLQCYLFPIGLPFQTSQSSADLPFTPPFVFDLLFSDKSFALNRNVGQNWQFPRVKFLPALALSNLSSLFSVGVLPPVSMQ